MIVGEIDGYPVVYNIKMDTVFCKNTKVSFRSLCQAINSSLDREQVDGKVDLYKHQSGYTLGCFELTKEQVKILILKIKQCQKQHK